MATRPLVLYHANCPDGFCAAWVAHKVFGDGADYVPVQYGEIPLDVRRRGDIYVLDFSYKIDVLDQMLDDCVGNLVVLDHHKTARDDLKDSLGVQGRLNIVFDMEKSGGRLTWDYFFPDRPSPWLVDYTEDRDLWRWKLDWSKELNAFLGSLPRTFDQWDKLTAREPRFIQEGAAILRYQAQLIEAISKTAREVEIAGRKVLAANTSCLFSEVAGELAKDRPFGAAWFVRSDGKRQWSLRSREGGVDVAEVARSLGGGGHRNAAGYDDPDAS
jgi:uncharacterized protein